MWWILSRWWREDCLFRRRVRWRLVDRRIFRRSFRLHLPLILKGRVMTLLIIGGVGLGSIMPIRNVRCIVPIRVSVRLGRFVTLVRLAMHVRMVRLLRRRGGRRSRLLRQSRRLVVSRRGFRRLVFRRRMSRRCRGLLGVLRPCLLEDQPTPHCPPSKQASSAAPPGPTQPPSAKNAALPARILNVPVMKLALLTLAALPRMATVAILANGFRGTMSGGIQLPSMSHSCRKRKRRTLVQITIGRVVLP
mmetsp:Transcript_13637/g.24669  ORF Transcript_13637/g.24669 Transcript_13637/m.24669 type:complete len:248 (-) Transcript_13637:237-980(-)